MMVSYVSVNGDLLPPNEFGFSPANRAFRYGDGVFETIRLEQGRVLWGERHYWRLRRSAVLLQMNWNQQLTLPVFTKTLRSLYETNHPDGESARLRFSLFRSEGGYYTPLKDDTQFIIESEPLTGEPYIFNERGLTLGLYQAQQKSADAYASLKTSSALLYVMASLYKKKLGYDDCVIVNQDGMVTEATSSNIFIVKNGQLITPDINQGCVEGIMRSVVIDLAEANDIIINTSPVTMNNLRDAHEVFLTNAIQGLVWVRCFEDKLYGNTLSRQLAALLQEKTMHDHGLQSLHK